METWCFHSQTAEETYDRGEALGRSIGRAGLAIALIGPLGAGKTVFVKGLASGLGVDPRVVSSPTFVIAQQYAVPAGPEALHHVDLYRLESSLELDSIGFDDMLGPGQVVAVEWADRFPEVLGRAYLSIEFEGPSPEEEDAAREGSAWRGRSARVKAHGENAERVLADWVERTSEASEESGVHSKAGGRLVSSPEMRLLMMGLMALGALGVGRLDFEAVTPPCERLVEIEADALGSLRVVCGDASDASDVSDASSAGRAELRGIARWLDGERVDLNRAPAALLERLPAIGPARATAIVEARNQRPFETVRDLERVRGIGPRIRGRLERWVRVDAIGAFQDAP